MYGIGCETSILRHETVSFSQARDVINILFFQSPYSSHCDAHKLQTEDVLGENCFISTILMSFMMTPSLIGYEACKNT